MSQISISPHHLLAHACYTLNRDDSDVIQCHISHRHPTGLSMSRVWNPSLHWEHRAPSTLALQSQRPLEVVRVGVTEGTRRQLDSPPTVPRGSQSHAEEGERGRCGGGEKEKRDGLMPLPQVFSDVDVYLVLPH